MSNEKCPGCGHVHVVPFSDEVRALVTKILQSEDPDERHALTMQLADSYADEADWADLTLPEELHKLAQRHLKLKADSYGAAMRLGRLLTRLVAAVEAHRQGSPPGLEINSLPTATKEGVGPN